MPLTFGLTATRCSTSLVCCATSHSPLCKSPTCSDSHHQPILAVTFRITLACGLRTIEVEPLPFSSLPPSSINQSTIFDISIIFCTLLIHQLFLQRILHFHFLPLLATFLFFIPHFLSSTYKNHRWHFFHFFFASTRFIPYYLVTLQPKMTDTHFHN